MSPVASQAADVYTVPALARADSYSILEAARIYRDHPDGLPQAALDQLLVGYPGSGKTLLLKKLCWDLLHGPEFLPVYIAVEGYVSQIAGEAVYSPDVRGSEPNAHMRDAITFLLDLALVDGTLDAGLPDIAAHGVEAITTGKVEAAPVATIGARYRHWRQTVLPDLTSSIELGQPVPETVARPPSVFAVSKAMGQAAQRLQKRLVLLVDQTDRLRPFYFRTLTGLLRRSETFVTIATRPSPSAPHATTMDAGAAPDHSTHWLGRSSPHADWSKFLAEVIHGRTDIDPLLSEYLQSRRETLDSLFRPSIRRVIEFTTVVREASRSLPFDDAWDYAVRQALDFEVNEAASSLAVVSGEPLAVIRDWQDRASTASPSRFVGAGFSVDAADRLTDRVQRFVRVCVRDGILIPRGTANPRFDQVLGKYEINPLVCAPERAQPDLSEFRRKPRRIPADPEDLVRWAGGRRFTTRGRRELPRVLVVGEDIDQTRTLAEALRIELEPAATILPANRGPKIDAEIRSSDLIAGDVSSVGAFVAYCLGLAVAASKPVKTAVLSETVTPIGWFPPSGLEGLPVDEALHALAFEIGDHLRRPASPVDRWRSDRRGRSLSYRAEANRIGVVGALRTMPAARELLEVGEHDFDFEIEILNTDDPPKSLFDLVRMARRNALLVVAPKSDSPTATALAMFVAGAAKTNRKVQIGAFSTVRRTIVIAPADMPLDFVNGDTRRFSTWLSARPELRRRLSTLARLSQRHS